MCLKRFLSPIQETRINIDNLKEFFEACQDFQWNHDTSTLHRSETNGQKGVVRRVKEGTAPALVESGLPEWRCWAVECYCYLHDVPDRMADSQTAFGQQI